MGFYVEKSGKKRAIDDDTMSLFCIEFCGGGYTPQQTANAMEVQENVRRGAVLVRNGINVGYEE